MWSLKLRVYWNYSRWTQPDEGSVNQNQYVSCMAPRSPVFCVSMTLCCRASFFIVCRRTDRFPSSGVFSSLSLDRNGVVWFISMFTSSSLDKSSYDPLVDSSGSIGMHRIQSSMLQFFPNSSPSSRVWGSRWWRVSGNLNPVNPPAITTPPIMTRGSLRFSLPK